MAPTEDRARVTIKDVARAAGTSITTVSLALRDVPGVREETRRRVREVAAALQYQPDGHAQRLRQRRTRLVGVVFALEQGFHRSLVDHLAQAAAGRGYEVAVAGTSPGRPESDVVPGLVADRCEGLVLVSPRSPRDQLLRWSRRVPLVLVGGRAPAGVDAVDSDDAAGALLAVGHLVGLGHERIAHLDGRDEPSAASRRAAYRAAMRRHGLGHRVQVVPGGSTAAEGDAAAARLLGARSWPTAVLCFNDLLALGVVLALHHRGTAVPADVSVVGCDDEGLAALPGLDLTTVRQSPQAVAVAALARLDGRIAAVRDPGPRAVGDRAEVELLPVELVVRASTGTARP